MSAIRERREALGLTQAELAKRAGTTQQTVDRLERGLTNFSRHRSAIEAVLGGVEPTALSPLKITSTSDGKVTLDIKATVSMGVAAQILALIEGDKHGSQ